MIYYFIYNTFGYFYIQLKNKLSNQDLKKEKNIHNFAKLNFYFINNIFFTNYEIFICLL